MNSSEKKALVIRSAFLAASLTAVFWTVWYLIVGSVPVTRVFELTSSPLIELPALSRWWDVPAAAILAALMVLALTVSDHCGEDPGYLILGLSNGMLGGLFIGLVFCGLTEGLVSGLVIGLVCGLILSLTVDLVLGAVCALVKGIDLLSRADR